MPYLNLGSLILGLIAWILPVVNIVKVKKNNGKLWIVFSVSSVGACAISLFMQIVNQNYLVKNDLPALMDTSYGLAVVSSVLFAVTLVLNIVSLILHLAKNHGQKPSQPRQA
jgi:cytochrome c oxidase subunit 4